MKHSTLFLTAILMCLGLALRSLGIGRLDFWYDEIALWMYSLTWEPPTPTEPPSMAWLLYAWMWWMKSADAFHIHFLPAVLGSLTIPLSFFLASRVDESRLTGLVAALLTTLSPMAIFYSREGRPYALFILASGVLYLGFIRAHERNVKGAWLCYSLLLCLCGLTHMLTAEIAIALGIFSVAARLMPQLAEPSSGSRASRFVSFLLFSLVGGLGSLWPLQRETAMFFRGVSGGVYPYGSMTFLRNVFVNLGPGPVGADTAFSFGLAELSAVGFCALFIVGLWRLHKKGRTDLALLFVLAVSVPLVIKYLTLGENVGSRWDWLRYISHTLLPFLVVASIGFEAFRRLFRRTHFQIGLLALLVASILPSAMKPPEREAYDEHRRIARYIEAHADNLEGVVILPYLHHLGSGDRRITNIYYYLKRDALPGFHLTGGEIRKLSLVPTRGNITQIPRANDYPETSMESGRYAVLSRRSFEDCARLPTWLNDIEATAGGSAPITSGLTLCDLEFLD